MFNFSDDVSRTLCVSVKVTSIFLIFLLFSKQYPIQLMLLPNWQIFWKDGHFSLDLYRVECLYICARKKCKVVNLMDPMIAFSIPKGLGAKTFVLFFRRWTQKWTVLKVLLFTLAQDIVINFGIKVAVSLNIGSKQAYFFVQTQNPHWPYVTNDPRLLEDLGSIVLLSYFE